MATKIRSLAFSALLLFIFSATGLLTAQSSLRIATNNYEPFYGETLPGNGPLLEIVQLAFARSGYETKIEFLPWERALALGRAGKCDLIAGVWSNSGRESWMAISDSIMENEVGLFKRKSDPLRFSDLADLKNQNIIVGTVAGYINPKELYDANIQTEQVSDDALNMLKLANGRIRLVLIDKRLGAYLAEKQKTLDQIEWLMTLEIIPLRIGIMKNSSGDWRKRLADFNAALLAMKRDGTLSAILARHGFR
ncbi:MAG: substrate-binding periplasmic protein [Spirochaetales bacterium]